MSKVCNICLVEKDLTEYYTNKGCADGYQNRCKNCTKRKSKEKLDLINADPVLKEAEQKRHREKYHRLAYKEKHKPTPEMKKEAIALYKSKYPEKYKAKIASQRMSKVNDDNELHHWSYIQEHWKDVIELSERDHQKAHRFIIYDQERFVYRRIDTMELLDTREKHEAYIFDCIANQPN